MNGEKPATQPGETTQTSHADRQMVSRVASIKKLLETIAAEVADLEGASPPDIKHGVDLKAEVRNLEIKLIKSALKHSNGYQHKAARLLGLKHTTLNSKIKRYGIAIRAHRRSDSS